MCNKIRFWSWTERQNGWEVIRRRDITGEDKVQWLNVSLSVCYRAAEGEQNLSSLCNKATGFTCSVFMQGILENSLLCNCPNNSRQIRFYLDHVDLFGSLTFFLQCLRSLTLILMQCEIKTSWTFVFPCPLGLFVLLCCLEFKHTSCVKRLLSVLSQNESINPFVMCFWQGTTLCNPHWCFKHSMHLHFCTVVQGSILSVLFMTLDRKTSLKCQFFAI